MLLDAVPGFHSTLYNSVTCLLFWHGHSPVGRVLESLSVHLPPTIGLFTAHQALRESSHIIQKFGAVEFNILMAVSIYPTRVLFCVELI